MEKLHNRVVRTLARRVLHAEGKVVQFPKEADLSLELGVSRSILRESMKVLVDKGMVEMKPKAGTRSRPRAQWRLLDPDILAWQAEDNPSPEFLRNLCEVRLAIEPTAAGFAAVRATAGEIAVMERCFAERSGCAKLPVERLIELDLELHGAIVEASHNPLLAQLSAIIRPPIRMALGVTAQFASTLNLGLEAHAALLDALRRHDPIAARRAADEVVGFAMVAVEKVIRKRLKALKEAS